MNWRHWIGLPPTKADIARHLMSTAQQAGNTNWQYDAEDSSLRSGERVINLGNLYLEFSRAPHNAQKPFLGNLDIVLGYDHSPTVTQVQASAVDGWGVSLDAALDHAGANLRTLPPPRCALPCLRWPAARREHSTSPVRWPLGT